MLIDEMNDLSTRPVELKERLATGVKPKPSELKQFGKYEYSIKLDTTVNVSGDTATATVVLDGGSAPVEKQWSFVKEGGQWKIKDAPLP